MNFEYRKLPGKLLQAQKDNKLVIFAGAGVSMGDPSNLPNFKSLTDEIVKQANFNKKHQEANEQVLGRLHNTGVNVKKLTKEILSLSSSSPTELHRLIIDLFNSQNIRIVTTNIDRHFSTVAKEKKLNIEQYYAPALPLGRDFKGIVYLHGFIDKDEKRIILTDKDFSQAYITDGWVTRFIKELFLNYTILFIGYSHKDIIMKYLIKGLPYKENDTYFTFARSGNKKEWEIDGFHPVEYDLVTTGSNRYENLNKMIQSWVCHVGDGIFEEKIHIEKIVLRGPSSQDNESAENIIDCILDPETIDFFTKHAQDPDWIEWIYEKDELKNLLNSTSGGGSLNYWLANNFSLRYPYRLLEAALKKNNKINSKLLEEIESVSSIKSDPFENKRALRMWIVILQNHKREKISKSLDYYLLERLCKSKANTGPSIDLFSRMISPILYLENDEIKVRYYGRNEENPEHDFSVNIDIVGRHHAHILGMAWEHLFEHNKHATGERLFFVLKEKIEITYSLLQPFYTEDVAFDPMARKIFKSRNIEVCRFFWQNFSELLKWIAEEKEALTGVALDWLSSDKLIFKRLAIIVLTHSRFHTATKKYDLFLSHELVFDDRLKDEVAKFFSKTYSSLPLESREILLQKIIGDMNEQ